MQSILQLKSCRRSTSPEKGREISIGEKTKNQIIKSKQHFFPIHFFLLSSSKPYKAPMGHKFPRSMGQVVKSPSLNRASSLLLWLFFQLSLFSWQLNYFSSLHSRPTWLFLQLSLSLMPGLNSRCHFLHATIMRSLYSCFHHSVISRQSLNFHSSNISEFSAFPPLSV